jgi:hypothetical protein
MEITITIKTADDEPEVTITAPTIDMAIEKLYALERVNKSLGDTLDDIGKGLDEFVGVMPKRV